MVSFRLMVDVAMLGVLDHDCISEAGYVAEIYHSGPEPSVLVTHFELTLIY